MSDLIERQAVLDGVASIAKAKARSDAQKALMGRVMFFTEHLSPVNPQPKIGHWIETDSDDSCLYMCSECHRRTDETSDYCPNCGCTMTKGVIRDNG